MVSVSAINYMDQTNWGGSCNDIDYQSPIDIPCEQYLMTCPPAKNYQVYWQNPMMQFGASPYEDLKTFFTNNSWVRFSNETNDYVFKSWQFHFHQPSEHTVNGQSYPLELHLVHKLDSTAIT
jgi:carbonic anhydrase